jgi:uncharacterized protein YkwD
MHVRVALLLAIVALGLAILTQTGGATQSGTPVARDPSGYCVSAEDHALLTRINQVRREAGAAPLQVSQAFGAAAQSHVASMSAQQYFAHDLIPDGLSWWELAQQFGATSQLHGENIAWGNADAQATVAQWMSDQIHYDNLVNPHYTVIGIGRITGPPPDPAFSGTTTIWAVTFGDHLEQAARPCPDDHATPAATAIPLSDAPTSVPIDAPLSDATAAP